MTDEAEYEIRCKGEPVAWASGPRDEAMKEARSYAYIYSQDGPTEIFEVHKTYTKIPDHRF